VNGEMLDKRMGVRVTIQETVSNLFGKILTLPASELQVAASARLSGSTRICMIGLSTTESETISLNTAARLTAAKCSVFSNSKAKDGIKSADSSYLVAERICSAGGYKGAKDANFTAAPITDCPPLGDPLASREPPFAGGCDYNKVEIKGGTKTLSPGVYCKGLKITEGAKVKLEPGVYIIEGESSKSTAEHPSKASMSASICAARARPSNSRSTRRSAFRPRKPAPWPACSSSTTATARQTSTASTVTMPASFSGQSTCRMASCTLTQKSRLPTNTHTPSWWRAGWSFIQARTSCSTRITAIRTCLFQRASAR